MREFLPTNLVSEMKTKEDTIDLKLGDAPSFYSQAKTSNTPYYEYPLHGIAYIAIFNNGDKIRISREEVLNAMNGAGEFPESLDELKRGFKFSNGVTIQELW